MNQGPEIDQYPLDTAADARVPNHPKKDCQLALQSWQRAAPSRECLLPSHDTTPQLYMQLTRTENLGRPRRQALPNMLKTAVPDSSHYRWQLIGDNRITCTSSSKAIDFLIQVLRHLVSGIDGIFIATHVSTVNVHRVKTSAIQELQREACARMSGFFEFLAEVHLGFNAEAFVPCLIA